MGGIAIIYPIFWHIDTIWECEITGWPICSKSKQLNLIPECEGTGCNVTLGEPNAP